MEADNVNRETEQKVADFLEQFITKLTQVEYSIEDLQKAYPFHYSFVTKPLSHLSDSALLLPAWDRVCIPN